MKTILLPYAFLRASLRLAATKDIRYYLNGVLIDIHADHARIVSTDGHRLGCFYVKPEENEELPRKPCQIIIPRDALKGLKPGRKEVYAQLAYDPEKPLAECRIADRLFLPIDGKFPDYLRILPNSAPSGEPAEFNAYYLADFNDMRADVLGHTVLGNAIVYPNGNGAAPVLFQGIPEFYGAIMPMRGSGLEWKAPAWL